MTSTVTKRILQISTVHHNDRRIRRWSRQRRGSRKHPVIRFDWNNICNGDWDGTSHLNSNPDCLQILGHRDHNFAIFHGIISNAACQNMEIVWKFYHYHSRLFIAQSQLLMQQLTRERNLKPSTVFGSKRRRCDEWSFLTKQTGRPFPGVVHDASVQGSC